MTEAVRSGRGRAEGLRPERPGRAVVRAGLALALTGVLATALGTTLATTWTVASTATSSAALDGAAAAVTVPGLLEAREGPVVVRATGEGEVALGVGREDDATAWLGAEPAVPAARLTGFDPEGGAVVVQPPSGGASAEGLPSAAGADLWWAEAAGQGAAELTHEPSGSAGSPVVVATSSAGALEQVSLTWPVQVAHPAALPLLVLGGLLLLAGLALLALARRGVRGAGRPGAPPPVPPPPSPPPPPPPSPSARPAAPAPSRRPAPAGSRRGAKRLMTRPQTARPQTAGRVAVLAVLPALTVLPLLTGCAAEPLEPRPQATPEPAPVVSPEQLARILDGPQGVRPTVEAADEALDAEQLARRVDGAPLAVRRAAYAVAAAAVAADPAAATGPMPALGGERLVEALPVAGQWPRFLVTVSEPAPSGGGGEGSGGGAGDDAGLVPEPAEGAPVLELLAQADPRAPYELVATAVLLPGATFPQLTQTAGAVEVVAPDAGGGLRLPPAEALQRYADVLARGGESPSAAEFAPDAFTGAVLAEQGAEAAAGAQYLQRTFTHTPREGALWALRTADGGAVVVGVLDGTRSFTTNTAGVTLPLPPDLAALGGRPAASAGSITTAETVVLTVPPAEQEAQLAVVGAQRAFTAVSLS